VRRHPHIEAHADDLGLLRQGRKLGERAVDVAAGLRLVAEVVRAAARMRSTIIKSIGSLVCLAKPAKRWAKWSAVRISPLLN
jgi:hypothetical protein